MDALIERHHVHYRVMSGARTGAEIREQLDMIAQRELPSWLDRAFDQAFGDDPGVYIVRDVHTRFAISLVLPLRSEIAGVWGEFAVNQVVDAVLHPDAVNVVSFPDQAAYLAQFISDLLNNQIDKSWYYFPLMGYRRATIAATLHALFTGQPTLVAPVLATLHSAEMIEPLIERLGNAAIDLWSKWIAVDALPPLDSFRPLFAEAVRLADLLNAWVERPASLESLFRVLAPELSFVDWRSTESLTAEVLHILQTMNARGVLNFSDISVLPTGAEWLDTHLLQIGLRRLFDMPETAYTHLVNDLSAREQALIFELTRVLRGGTIRFSRLQATSAANATRWYAALIAEYPVWRNDPLVAATIDQLLKLWSRAMVNATGEIVSFDPVVQAAVDALTRSSTASALDMEVRDGFTTDCAGLFLLVRAVQDLSLIGLAEQHGFPASIAGLMWALGRAWMGDILFDPAVTLLAGINDESTLAQAWLHDEAELDAAYEGFSVAIAGLLIGQHAVDPDTLVLLSYSVDDITLQVVTTSDGRFPLWAGDIAALSRWQSALEARYVHLPVIDQSGDSDASERLGRTVEAMGSCLPGSPIMDLRVRFLAAAVVSAWGRWLTGFSESSVPYLLDGCIRRAGQIDINSDEIWVMLESRPLDVVLRAAGYFDLIEQVSWLDGRRVHFHIEGI